MKEIKNMIRHIFAAIFALTATPAVADCGIEEQIEALALNMYHEARDQGIDGMILVGEVTLNRVYHKHFPNNICDVVYQGQRDSTVNMIRYRCQFSWYCDGLSDTPKNQKAWEMTLDLAENIIDGNVDFFGINSTHYLNPDKVSNMPTWASVYQKTGQWGDHVFYYSGNRL